MSLPDYLRPKTGYFLGTDDAPWRNRSISANDETKPEKCLGYTRKTIEFTTDTAGTLTILVDLIGDGSFSTYEEISVSAGETVYYVMTAPVAYVKLRFSVAATVTAKYNFARYGG